MFLLSPGYVHSAIKLLDMVAKRDLELTVLSHSLPKVELLPTRDIIEFAVALGWVVSDADGKARLSQSGSQFLAQRLTPSRFRQCLLDYVSILKPPWAQLAWRGREETLRLLAPEVRQCFAEAGLDRSLEVDVVDWWDALAVRARGLVSSLLNQIGRRGERMSLEFEHSRTKRAPRWHSVESNLSGYDILSVVANGMLVLTR